MNRFNQFIFYYNNNPTSNNLILNGNYHHQFRPPPLVIPIARYGGFPAPYSCLVNENSVSRAVIATPCLSLFGRPVRAPPAFRAENDETCRVTSKVKEEKVDAVTPLQPVEYARKNEITELKSIDKRKQTKPTRSLKLDDPSFRGVTFNVRVKVRQFESKLVFRHVYSGLSSSSRISCRNRRQRRRRRLLSSSFDCVCASYDKQCASCGTAKTPLWRDAEDGTPLCNACGIRYKKYRIRCTTCWRIPRKDRKSRVFCSCASSR